MLSIREEEYVQALHAFGLSDLVICFKHMLPNALSPILVNITINVAAFILEEASLSFLGLGVPLAVPTWGNYSECIAGYVHTAECMVDVGSCRNCYFSVRYEYQFCW